MKQQNLVLFLLLNTVFASTFASTFARQFPPARQSYQELNSQASFAVSFGTAISQTHHTANTANPDWMSQRLQKLALATPEPKKFLTHKDHIGYTLKALANYICSQCGASLQPTSLNIVNDATRISKLLDDVVQQKTAEKLTLTTCPECTGQLIEQPRKSIILTPDRQQAMIDQINYLGVKNQSACTNHDLPTYRISLEASDVLKQNSTEIDPLQIQTQAQFICKMGNPLLFFHHYANPQTIPDLFEKSEHSEWFANYCAEMIKACPHVTHVCPISQPVAFAHRVTRSSLPPFSISISQTEYLKNINNAQVLACKKMKEINPNLKVLMSHQWKPMKPYHSMLNPWYALEKLICTIANRMYNGDFVTIFTPHQDLFDGIALSVYPALYFNGWIPHGNNCCSTFSADDALEAIMQTHQAFPTKDIYIVETGCNTNDAQTKKDFIDMTLAVCKIAREKGVSIKGVYFWSHTNDPEFYSEWNLQPGSTNFSPFDRLDPLNPCDSVNAGGKYLKEILTPQ